MTIVVPVYNEQDNMDMAEERVAAYLPLAKCASCVLFVNDGSKDGSLQSIESICSRHNDFFYIGFAELLVL